MAHVQALFYNNSVTYLCEMCLVCLLEPKFLEDFLFFLGGEDFFHDAVGKKQFPFISLCFQGF